MTANEYFKWALARKYYAKRDWVIATNGLPYEDGEPVAEHLPYVKDNSWWFLLDGIETKINKPFNDEPLFVPEDKITLTPEDLPNITEDVKTCIGNALFNAIVFVFPFGNRLPYLNKNVSGKELDSVIGKALNDGLITTDEYAGKFSIAMGFLTVWTQLIIPAATPKSLQSPPGIEKVRDDFIKANADRMNTKEAAAELDGILTDMLKEHLKGDPSMKHLLKGNAFATVRKKLYGSLGSATAMDDPDKVIYTSKSLKEGWGPKDMYAVANEIRAASTLRGIETQTGGYSAKKLTRAYQGAVIDAEDCESPIGLRMNFDDSNYQFYIGRYLVGSKEPLTESSAKALIGKDIRMRDPNGCKAKNYCRTCFGDAIGRANVGLGSQMAAFGSQALKISLSLFHASELKLKEFVPERHFF